MEAPVHISVDRKRKITVLIHADDTDRVLVIPAPHILTFLVRETEHFRQLSTCHVVKPEFSLLHESCHCAVAVGSILYVIGSNPEEDAVLIEFLRRPLEEPFHIPVVIQQINRPFYIAYTEEFLNVIN